MRLLFHTSLLAMHIPDGFLSLPVAGLGWLLMVIWVGIALRQTRAQLGERQIPLMGVLAAFIFAAQMINFPVAGGTSGHLLGGALAAILLGPWEAVLVMTSVISIQALLFQDGGLLAIGFNVFNMGILTIFAGYLTYKLTRRLFPGHPLIGAALGAWIGVEAAAIAASFELAASGTSPLTLALPTMVGVHALIGIGEALITVGALTFIRQTRPDLLDERPAATSGRPRWAVVGLLLALTVVLLAPLSDPNPDGLRRIVNDLAAHGNVNVQAAGQDPLVKILPGYTVPFLADSTLSTIVAGMVGVLAVALIVYSLARLIRRNRVTRTE